VAVLAGRALDTPLSAAADVCCYGVVVAACIPLIALYCTMWASARISIISWAQQ
jgi:hypothetical protein